MNEGVVEEIKARIDLADLIASYGVALKRTGAGYMACCPFHHEKTPSFSIQPAKGYYHCFGCGESGDAIKFVQKFEGLSFPEAMRKLADQLGIKLEEKKADPDAGKRKRLYALMAELADFYRRCLEQTKEAEPARKYLAERALDGKVAEDWTIGYAPAGVSVISKWAGKYGYTMEELAEAGVVKAPDRPGDLGYHRFGRRLMFTVRDKQGRVVAFSGRQLVRDKNSGKYVNSPETLIFKKSNVLFGFDKAAANIAKAPHREAIVCEGQIDTIRLHVSGFPVALASQGTAFTEEHARMLKRVADQVLLVFDDDNAGHKATIRTAGIMLAQEMPVRTVTLPDGEDPDSYLRKHPAEDFQKLLDGAESIVAFQCRVEKAKESNPNTIDAVARISKAVLGTIARCPSAVLKAQMVGEAAKLLSLPAAALQEELGKIKVEEAGDGRGRARAAHEAEDPMPDADCAARDPYHAGEPCQTGEAAEEVAPPSALEQSFMAFLKAHERDAKLDPTVGEFLPVPVFGHPFTARFTENWRLETKAGEDAFAAFAASLAPHERVWFDTAMADAARVGASTEDADETLQDFVRRLWIAALSRRRGALPAVGDDAALMERMRISTDMRRLDMIKWSAVKDLIRQYDFK